MKKVITLLFMIFNLITLVGCDPSSYCYSYDELSITVKSVELITYDNNEAIELFEKRDKVKDFDFSKMSIEKELDEDKLDKFLLEFSKIEFMLVWRHLDSPKGESIKINYIDGGFDIICYTVQFSCKYDANGKVNEFIGSGGGSQLKKIVDTSFQIN